MTEDDLLDNIEKMETSENNNYNSSISQIDRTTFIDEDISFHISTPINKNIKINDNKWHISPIKNKN